MRKSTKFSPLSNFRKSNFLVLHYFQIKGVERLSFEFNTLKLSMKPEILFPGNFLLSKKLPISSLGVSLFSSFCMLIRFGTLEDLPHLVNLITLKYNRFAVVLSIQLGHLTVSLSEFKYWLGISKGNFPSLFFKLFFFSRFLISCWHKFFSSLLFPFLRFIKPLSTVKRL